MTTLSSFCRFLLNSTTLSNPTKSTGFSVTNFPSDCEIDVVVEDEDEVLHGEIEDKVENYDKQEVEHVTRDLLYNMEDLFNENFDRLSYDSNMNDVSLCRKTKRVNSVCQTDRRITRQRKSISS